MLHHWFNCIVVAYAAEHDRLAEAYSVINQKLQYSLSEKTSFERTIQEYKVCDDVIVVKGFVLSFFHWCSCISIPG